MLMATFVIVHGAFGGAWSWNKLVAPLLRKAGHEVHAITLTGLGDRIHLATPEVDLDTHIQDVVNVLFYEDLPDVILAGHTRKIDLGSVNGYAFFNVASIGISADLATGLDPQLKKRFGRFGYALAAAKVLAKARPFTATIRENGGVTTVKTFQIAVGNGRHYGGGNVIEENAEIDDGHLDLYSLEMSRVWKLAGLLRSFRSGTHGAWKEVRTAKSDSFEIETKKPMPVNADGEIVTATPARFVVHPEAITVLAPPKTPAPEAAKPSAAIPKAKTRKALA
jgi:diacylglycerol kinase family enzyme